MTDALDRLLTLLDTVLLVAGYTLAGLVVLVLFLAACAFYAVVDLVFVRGPRDREDHDTRGRSGRPTRKVRAA